MATLALEKENNFFKKKRKKILLYKPKKYLPDVPPLVPRARASVSSSSPASQAPSSLPLLGHVVLDEPDEAPPLLVRQEAVLTGAAVGGGDGALEAWCVEKTNYFLPKHSHSFPNLSTTKNNMELCKRQQRHWLPLNIFLEKSSSEIDLWPFPWGFSFCNCWDSFFLSSVWTHTFSLTGHFFFLLLLLLLLHPVQLQQPLRLLRRHRGDVLQKYSRPHGFAQ